AQRARTDGGAGTLEVTLEAVVERLDQFLRRLVAAELLAQCSELGGDGLGRLRDALPEGPCDRAGPAADKRVSSGLPDLALREVGLAVAQAGERAQGRAGLHGSGES